MLRENPNLLMASLVAPPPTPEADRRLQSAELSFQDGRRLQRAGDWDRARTEFDRAVEVLLRAPANLPGRERLEQRFFQMREAIHQIEWEELTRDNPEPIFDKSPLDDILEKTFPIDPRLSPKIREQVLATASQLPLEVNADVIGYIQYFSTRGRNTVLAGLRRAGRYRDLIGRILDEEGLPPELIHLAQAESGFLPRAVSRKKATGMWQFIRSRGLEYGLRQTKEIDERLDPEKATRAAAKHLKDLFAQFGDWYLAMAAYNSGPVTVQRAVERTGYADVWILRQRKVLPRETTNYIPIIVALTIMAKNPREYDLQSLAPEPAVDYDTVEASEETHLGLIADILGKTLSEVRELNPSILRVVAPAGYSIRIPKGSAGPVLAALHLIPSQRRASWRLHRVSSSETVEEIARRYRLSEKLIASVNPEGAMTPEEGDLLVIPAGYPEARSPAKPARKTQPLKRPASQKPAVRGAAPRSTQATYASRRLADARGSVVVRR